jgi:hypothetical protein
MPTIPKDKIKTDADLRSEFWSAPDQALLSRKVTAAGICRSVAWLQLKATEGGGIPYLKNGKYVLYRKSDTLAWLKASSQLVTSTSEYKQAPAAPWKEGKSA